MNGVRLPNKNSFTKNNLPEVVLLFEIWVGVINLISKVTDKFAQFCKFRYFHILAFSFPYPWKLLLPNKIIVWVAVTSTCYVGWKHWGDKGGEERNWPPYFTMPMAQDKGPH